MAFRGRAASEPGTGSLLQELLQELAGVGGLTACDIVGGARDHHFASTITTLGSEIDDPVGGLDDIEIVLDDHHRVALLDQPIEHAEQLREMGFVPAEPLENRPRRDPALFRWQGQRRSEESGSS